MWIFYPRYKRYASWPAVLWCRLRGHPVSSYFYSGDVARCIDCGDTQFISERNRKRGG